MRIFVTGSSGLVGKALCRFLETKGHQVQGLKRNNSSLNALEGADAVIHLAGENLSKGLWTKNKKKKIYDSRIEGTRSLVRGLANLQNPPKVLIAASAVGYYKEQKGPIDENGMAGNSFLSSVCKDWEEASQRWDHPLTRVVIARFGYVLSKEGGLLQALKPIFSLGLGAVMGGGEQFMPWIDIEDLVRSLEFILEHKEIEGPVNITAPNPVTNNKFSKVLAKILGRPCFFFIPKWLIIGEKMKSLLLPSLEVYPTKLQKNGFHFLFSQIEDSLTHQLFE